MYERRGDDLVVTVPVPYTTAALGGIVEAPTPDGTVSLKVPPAPRTGSCSASRGAASRT